MRCPECLIDIDAVRVYVSALVPRTLRDQLREEAARSGVSLRQVIVTKLAAPLGAKGVCQTCAELARRRQREFGETLPPRE